MTSNSRATTAARHIQLCLFLIELSLAVGIAVSAYIVLNILPFSTPWVSRLGSTLMGIWIIKSTVGALQKNRSVREGGSNNEYDDDELFCNEEIDRLKSYELRQKSIQQPKTKHVRFEGGEKEEHQEDVAYLSSKEIEETKKFLTDTVDENEYTSKISFPLIAVLATVLLHTAVRFLVIAQNLRRYLATWRGQSTRNGLIQLSEIPFIIGRSVSSSSGCSFHLFSFLNQWLESNGYDLPPHDSSSPGDAFTENTMKLQAVSFDRISINSSHILINPPRNPAARSQLSWLGIIFEDIDMSLKIILKRKGRRVDDQGNDKYIKSFTIRLKIKALEIGVFPSFTDWCRGSGIQFDAVATFDACEKLDGDTLDSISGFGMSVDLSQLNMHRFTCLAESVEEKTNSKSKVVSWKKIECSLYLDRQTRLKTHRKGEDKPTREMTSLTTLPSGFVLIHDSSSTRDARINLGCSLGDESRVALGVHLHDMQKFVQSVELLLRNLSSSMIKGSSLKSDTCAMGNKSNQKTSLHVVEVNVVTSIHLFSYTSDANSEYLSLWVTHSTLHWKKNEPSESVANADQIEERTRNNPNPMLVLVDSVNLRFEACQDRIDDSNIDAVLDLVVLKRIKSTLANDCGCHILVDRSKCTTLELGDIIVRTDGCECDKLACIMKACEEIALAAANFHSSVKEMKQSLSVNTKQKSQGSAAASQIRKQDVLERFEVSCHSVDAVIKLIDGGDTNGDIVRLAWLQGETSMVITENGGNRQEEGLRWHDYLHLLPDQLFSSVQACCSKYYLIETTVAHGEGSVTFCPHSSLPVINEASPPSNTETCFYGEVAKMTIKSAVPLNKLQAKPTVVLAKAIWASCDELYVYERFRKGAELTPFLSVPVHVSAKHSSAATADVQIVQCKGSICLVEKVEKTIDKMGGERAEFISVQFNKGSTELELVWSPILQWFQVSCNNRVQRSLARLKALASTKATKRTFTSHKTHVRLAVDSNVTANMYLSVGVKTPVQTVVKKGLQMNVSFAKYLSASSNSMRQLTKPNISFQATHMAVLLNNIESPIFTFDCVSLKNFIRRASEIEIHEYASKKEKPCDDYSGELVVDQDGRPLKEIVDVEIKRANAKFPSALHFGQCIDDFVLLPKALDIGLDRLKEGHQKRPKKFQLMSIRCILPFLDISLMDNDPDLLFNTTPTKRSILQDVFRICFEGAKVSIERNAPPEWTQSQINALDEDDSATYGPAIQGGLVCLAVKHVMCTLHPLNLATPLIRTDDLAINGHLYLAGLSPTTPGIQDGKMVSSLLLCHHNLLRGNCDSESLRQCCCCYGVSLHSTGIPVKLYADGKITCSLDICYGPIMDDSIPLLMACIDRFLPPSPKSPTQVPLSWWDNTRFFVHGSISLAATKLSFRWLLDSHINRDQSLLFECQKFCIDHTVGSFDINASHIIVSIPGATYDMSVHPSKRDKRPTFHLPHEAESSVGRGRHPLIYVPSFKADVKFFWSGTTSGHHYVYMKHNTETNTLDKFAKFRSDGIHVEFDFEIMGSDDCDSWVALRIDVLPWITHLNSSLTFTQLDEERKSDPLPKFKSVAINACTTKLRVATWFEDENDLDGLCLIVQKLSYNAAVDGSKDIVIGGVQGIVFDVSDFKHVEEQVEDITEDIMIDIEQMASEFGANQSRNESENEAEINDELSSSHHQQVGSKDLFFKLQKLTSEIDELDFVVVTGQIDIRNQSLAKMLAGCDRTTLKRKNSEFEGVDRTTWSVLVSRLRLLWTIEIRDAIMAISKDLIYAIGFMKSQYRQLQLMSGTLSLDDSARVPSPAGEGIELSLHEEQPKGALQESMLDFLLEDGVDADLAPSRMNATSQGDISASTAHSERTLPTLDLHFSNPQVQLHSISTGGSIILAAEGARVEGKKYMQFVTSARTGKVSPSDLLRKTEHIYTLTNMDAYSLSAHVDVNVGLPWLDVCSPGRSPSAHQRVALEERFGISDEDKRCSQQLRTGHNDDDDDSKLLSQNLFFTYPEDLVDHEPFPFLKSGILRPISPDRFTFQSIQRFHRPPVHYSTEELVGFIKQGLVASQEEAVVDDIQMNIDLLNFNLDSYQFKTTIDVIRNVLLEPPKPHQRHFDQDTEDINTDHKSSRKVSKAATDMEELLQRDADGKYGKKGRQAIQTAATILLQDLEDSHKLEGGEVFRQISYTLCKLKWVIQSQDEIDDVTISFTGFNGKHDYSRDGSVVSQFSLEDVRVSSSKPGPDSIGFSDPTSVVSSVVGNERSPCQRCGQRFDHSNNDNSCLFHPGQFESRVWTCCDATNASAPGCKSSPHTGKEMSVVVRVESLPRIVEGLSVYSHCEVNLFPGLLHTLVVQVSKSLSRLFMSYFFLEDENDDDDAFDTMSTTSNVTGSFTDSLHSPKPIIQKKSLLIGGKRSPSDENQGTPELRDPSIDDSTFKLKPTNEAAIEESEIEVAFIKVFRIGNVDMNVSLGGFKRLPISSLGISVPDYSKAYEMGTWESIGRKYLTYLVREVLKSGASSGLDKFRRKVMLESSDAERSRSAPPMPSIPDTAPVNVESFIGKHRHRPVGKEDILGAPTKSSKKKRRGIFKHKR